jgi:hypothetical protein
MATLVTLRHTQRAQKTAHNHSLQRYTTLHYYIMLAIISSSSTVYYCKSQCNISTLSLVSLRLTGSAATASIVPCNTARLLEV